VVVCPGEKVHLAAGLGIRLCVLMERRVDGFAALLVEVLALAATAVAVTVTLWPMP
jgi:hypothetical protein